MASGPSPGKRIQRHRAAAIKRQNNLCYWCQREMLPANRTPETPKHMHKKWAATADHYPIPRRDGGGHTRHNIVAAHAWCNSSRENVSADAPSWTHEEYLETRDDLLRALSGGDHAQAKTA